MEVYAAMIANIDHQLGILFGHLKKVGQRENTLVFFLSDMQSLFQIGEVAMHNRRLFLKQSSLIALAPTVPGFLSNYARRITARQDQPVLVVIQLDGGNDGINTVVPFTDEGYTKNRKELVLKTSSLLKLDRERALNPRVPSFLHNAVDGSVRVKTHKLLLDD